MLMFAAYIVLSSLGIILFKLGSSAPFINVLNKSLEINVSFVSLIGLFCYLGSFVLWMMIISKSEVHIVVPLGLGLTNILILFGSYFILGESLSVQSIIGATLVILGIMIMN